MKTISKWAEFFQDEIISGASQSDIISHLEQFYKEKFETNKSKPEDSKNYQVAFGNNLGAIIKITDNKIEIENAIDGWGDPIMLSQIEIIEIK